MFTPENLQQMEALARAGRTAELQALIERITKCVECEARAFSHGLCATHLAERERRATLVLCECCDAEVVRGEFCAEHAAVFLCTCCGERECKKRTQ